MNIGVMVCNSVEVKVHSTWIKLSYQYVVKERSKQAVVINISLHQVVVGTWRKLADE